MRERGKKKGNLVSRRFLQINAKTFHVETVAHARECVEEKVLRFA